MAPRKPYPLESVEQQRKQRVEDQAADLSIRTGEVHSAARRRTEAELARDAHHRAVADVRQHEAGRWDRGDVRVDDLLRLQAFQIAQSEVARSHARSVEVASREEHSAQQRQQESRSALATARAEAELIGRHHRAFDSAESRRELEAAEADAEEAHNARAHRGRA